MAIPSYFAFVGHGYLLYLECGWPDPHCLHYYISIIAASYRFRDSVAFGYGKSFLVVIKRAMVPEKKEVERDLREVIGTNEDDKFKKEGDKNKGSVGISTRSAEAPYFKITAVRIQRD